jgi:hypothetical protein
MSSINANNGNTNFNPGKFSNRSFYNSSWQNRTPMKPGSIQPPTPMSNPNLKCVYCGKIGHTKQVCFRYIADQNAGVGNQAPVVNFVGSTNQGRRESFTTTGTVDSTVTNILRDTGADITIVQAKLLRQPKWLYKTIEVTSAFGIKHDLPVARVYISSVYGKGYEDVGVS